VLNTTSCEFAGDCKSHATTSIVSIAGVLAHSIHPTPGEEYDIRVPLPELNPHERQRYSRHILLPEIGEEGQRKLKDARVLCVGAGGLGSPALLYLAAAGVGTIGLIDFDAVDFTNLQRQIVHDTASVGQSKVESARARIAALNPSVHVETFNAPFSVGNAK